MSKPLETLAEDFPETTAAERQLLFAAITAGRRIMNTLRSIGIEPSEITGYSQARDTIWPAPWAFDCWCAWYACKIALQSAGWHSAVDDISTDMRTSWRTSSRWGRSTNRDVEDEEMDAVLRQIGEVSLPDGALR